MSLLSRKFWQRLLRRTMEPRCAGSHAQKVFRKRFQLEELESRLTPSGAWGPTASLTVARDWQAATLLNSGLNSGKVLLVGGNQGGTNFLNSAEIYDPTVGAWSPAASMTTARSDPTATFLGNGDVLVTGGLGINNGKEVGLASAELYDPNLNSWSSAGSMAAGRNQQTATLLSNGKVLVVGGANNGSVAGAQLYDPSSNIWSAAGSMATLRAGHTATLLNNGEVLVAGGYTNLNGFWVSVSSAELYDPSTNTWSSAGNMATAKYDYTATALANGMVLVTGGHDTSGHYLSAAELYNPANNTWTSTNSMATARAWHTASLLGNGKVLVAAGWNPTDKDLSSTELYDPASGTWSFDGALATPRDEHTATVLPSGQVLVAGGETLVGTSYVALSSAEIYQSQAAFVIAGPNTATAGSAFNFTVTAEDASGNTLTGYTGTVHFASSDPQAVLLTDYTFNAGDAGAHTFSATLKKSGSQSLIATDTANSLSGQTSVQINAAAATRLVLSGPNNVNANSAFSITVTAYDAFGNVATGYRGTVHFSDTGTGSTLPKNYTFTASDSGVHTFTGMKLKSKGTHTITVVDTGNGSLMGTLIVSVT